MISKTQHGLLSSLGDDLRLLSRRQKWGLVLLVSIAVLINADQQALAPNLVAIQREFGVSDYDIGLMTGTFFIVGAIVGVLIGRKTDLVRNRKYLVVVVTMLSGIPCLLTAFVKTYHQLFTARVLTSFGVIGAFPILYALMGDYFRKENRNFGNAAVGMLYTLGIVFGQLVAGWLGPPLGWRTPFLVLSLPNFILILLFALSCDVPQRGAAEDAIRERMRRGYVLSRRARLRNYLATIRRPAVALAILQGIPGSIAGGMLSLFIVKFLQIRLAWDVERAASIVALMALGGLVGSILGGYAGGYLYRRDPRSVPIFCAVTTILGASCLEFLLYFPAWAPEWCFIPIAVVGSALIFVTIPNLKAVLTNLTSPERRGVVFSLLGVTDDLGDALGPFVGGVLSASWGLGAALRIGAALWFPCALFWFLIALGYGKGEVAADNEILDAAATMAKLPTGA